MKLEEKAKAYASNCAHKQVPWHTEIQEAVEYGYRECAKDVAAILDEVRCCPGGPEVVKRKMREMENE